MSVHKYKQKSGTARCPPLLSPLSFLYQRHRPAPAQLVTNTNIGLIEELINKTTIALPQSMTSAASTAAVPNAIKCNTKQGYYYFLFISLILAIIHPLMTVENLRGWTHFYGSPPTDAIQKGFMAPNADAAATTSAQERVSSMIKFDSSASVKMSSYPSRISVTTITPPTIPLRTHTNIVSGTNHCWRECPFGRNNKIIYTNSWRAGLNDRTSIIKSMANLAAYLCATLEFPLPLASLTPRHNGNNNVSSSLVWDDFLVVATVEDPNVTSKQKQSLLLLRDLKDELNNITESQKYSSMQWIKVVSNNASNVVSEFDFVYSTITTADDYTKPFVWFFELNWYKVRDSLANHFKTLRLINPPFISKLKPSCIYCIIKQSPRAKKISDYLWNVLVTDTEHLARNATMGYLHIRRTDTAKQCNTTLDRIRSYLECSLMDVSGNVTLLLGTDEKDPNYIAGIQHIVENELSGGHKLFHLDAWIFRQLELMAIQKDDATGKWNVSKTFSSYLNNYHVYLFGKSISSKATFKLEKRRKEWCNDCDPVKV
jgi:hypothetical protein